MVNAINCARRGWINVDMDTIACESCGARLLFSTPSSWNQQQGMILYHIDVVMKECGKFDTLVFFLFFFFTKDELLSVFLSLS